MSTSPRQAGPAGRSLAPEVHLQMRQRPRPRPPGRVAPTHGAGKGPRAGLAAQGRPAWRPCRPRDPMATTQDGLKGKLLKMTQQLTVGGPGLGRCLPRQRSPLILTEPVVSASEKTPGKCQVTSNVPFSGLLGAQPMVPGRSPQTPSSPSLSVSCGLVTVLPQWIHVTHLRLSLDGNLGKR